MKVLVTGATGFVGSHLMAKLDDVVVLSTNVLRAKSKHPEAKVYKWSASMPVPKEALEGVDAVVHLAGEPVAGKWTDEKKKAIRDSRVDGTRRIVEAIATAKQKPKVLVCASAVGYYGSRADEKLTESAEAGSGFLADVCREWELEALRAEQFDVRVVRTRFGFVIGADGGAIPEMVTPFRWGLGAWFGSGKQWTPWVHIDDVVGLLLKALRDEQISGPVNVVAPEPVHQRRFAKALAGGFGMPAIFPMPVFLLEMFAGEQAQLMTSSQNVVCEKAMESGYEFKFRDVESACEQIARSMEEQKG